MALLIRLLVVAFFVWVIWFIWRSRSLFCVSIRAGRAEVEKGRVTRAFLEQIQDISDEYGIAKGSVRGTVRGSRVSLAFSRRFPLSAQQQIRNWWTISGWKAAPPRTERRILSS